MTFRCYCCPFLAVHDLPLLLLSFPCCSCLSVAIVVLSLLFMSFCCCSPPYFAVSFFILLFPSTVFSLSSHSHAAIPLIPLLLLQYLAIPPLMLLFFSVPCWSSCFLAVH